MNLQEFAALKVGDRIANHMTDSHGEVAAIDAKGVHVRWADARGAAVAGGTTRHYSVQTTAWFNWSKIECTQDCRTAGECLGH